MTIQTRYPVYVYLLKTAINLYALSIVIGC